MQSRRDFYRIGSCLLGGMMSLGLAIPGISYVLDPLRRKVRAGTTQELTRLSALKVGVPQAFPIIDERRDTFVKYPREPIGTVWLIRQAEGAATRVVGFTASCPHLGCLIALQADARSFICHCHGAKFDLKGAPANKVAPRAMDELPVHVAEGDDPAVVVSFQRFRTQAKKKVPLV